jgi:CysZ protein
MLLKAVTRALRNLLLPDMLRLLLLCLVLYAVGWSLLAWGLSALIGWYTGITGAEGVIVHLASGAGSMVIAWFLFPLLFPLLVNFFDDSIAEAVERRDYPQLPSSSPPYWPTVLQDIWFSLKALALNLLCLPFYLLPVAGLCIYYLLNGYLLGTQFFRMAAGRRVNHETGAALERNHMGVILLGGLFISLLATVPVLNLVAALVGVACMLHLFHALNGTQRLEILPPS